MIRHICERASCSIISSLGTYFHKNSNVKFKGWILIVEKKIKIESNQQSIPACPDLSTKIGLLKAKKASISKHSHE